MCGDVVIAEMSSVNSWDDRGWNCKSLQHLHLHVAVRAPEEPTGLLFVIRTVVKGNKITIIITIPPFLCLLPLKEAPLLAVVLENCAWDELIQVILWMQMKHDFTVNTINVNWTFFVSKVDVPKVLEMPRSWVGYISISREGGSVCTNITSYIVHQFYFSFRFHVLLFSSRFNL